jgi:hypothetical protein
MMLLRNLRSQLTVIAASIKADTFGHVVKEQRLRMKSREGHKKSLDKRWGVRSPWGAPLARGLDGESALRAIMANAMDRSSRNATERDYRT